MREYIVTGMSCAACSARVEKAVGNLQGVDTCTVNLLTNQMLVDGSAADEEIVKAVIDAGYGIQDNAYESEFACEETEYDSEGAGGIRALLGIKSKRKNVGNDRKKSPKTDEFANMRRRLTLSLIFWILLMYISMGHMMWDWPVPGFLNHNHTAMGLIELVLTVIVMIINRKFFISGFKSLSKKAPNMDTLVALGASAAFVYSLYSLWAIFDATAAGEKALAMKYMDELYFESAATILTLITVGKTLEAYSKGRTTDALKSLMNLAPKMATVIRSGEEIKVPTKEVALGDIFIVRPGESIPVDGVVIEGESAVDESALTGESIPIDKAIGDKVSAATINRSGFLKCETTGIGSDTMLSKIIKMVSDASATKAPIARIADKVSGIFVPVVLVIAAITFIVWMALGQEFGFALARSIAVLVISCPCALGLATPVAIMVGNGVGAKNGILFKNAPALEMIAGIDTVVLDKTGTITTGNPKVTDVISSDNDRLLFYAASLEKMSEHPLARAVVEYAGENPVSTPTEFKIHPGNGLSGIIDGKRIYGGNLKFINECLSKTEVNTGDGHTQMAEENALSERISITEEMRKQIDALSLEGKTPLLFASEDEFLGIIAVADTVKEDSEAAIAELRQMGIKVVMLTGDNENTARAIASKLSIDEVIAGVLPDGKEACVRGLKESRKVAMVGDGINDAPALVSADVGIAIGAGTDVAIDAADVVLVKSSILDVAAAIKLGRSTLRNIKENLFWAFIYNVIGIPLAAGVWYPLFGILLNPMFGAAAMSLSSFCVVTNALRLNMVKIYSDVRKDILNIVAEKENKSMEKKMIIEGMMCGHCEARVKKVLEELPEVSEAKVSHEEGTAVVVLKEEISDEKLTKTVADQGYEVKGIE